MALVQLGDVRRQIEELRAAVGSVPNPAILETVERAYSSGETVGSSFVKLLREVLSPLGVAVLDSSHPAVRKQGAPVMRRALERAAAVESALFARDAELKASGYSSQVQTVRGRSVVFSSIAGRRSRVSTSHAEETALRGDAVELSPNVLLRPILERSILPTVAYLGGPAEIAYFAQVSAVAAAIGYDPPLILPRWSGIVIEPRVQKILDRYSLDAGDFSDPHAIETRLARESIPEELRASIAELLIAVEQQIVKIEAADKDHLVSPKVIDGLRHNVRHRVERLERRYMAAIKHRGNAALHDVAAARASLYPLGIPQERALNVIPFVARYGEELFDSVMAQATSHAASLV
jgi:uncharacterized protein YllA (UPF0747 family)